ncbi:hypothetical protein C356_07047, partial [Cryptococcus neoformans c45]
LDDVSVHISSGKFTAFVGPSGSGKSTLASLLLRFYDPATSNAYAKEDRPDTSSPADEKCSPQNAVDGSGIIRFAGYDVRELNVTSLRQQIAVVQQNPQLISGTVFDNVAIGLTGSDLAYQSDIDTATTARYQVIKQRVISALTKAQAYDFVCQLPEGLNTIVAGGRTGVLSGGQVQRIAIARALIRQPRCLLLDEATSAVSADTEISIQEALLAEQRQRGMTLIVIAHRLSTIVAADRIVVMSAGKIVQSGTYDELMDPSCPNDTFRSLALPTAQQIPAITSTPSSTATNTTVASSILKIPDLSTAQSLPPAIKSISHAFLNVRTFLFFGVALGLVGGASFVVAAWLQGRAIVTFSIPDLSRMKYEVNRWALWFLIVSLGTIVIVSFHGFFLEYSGELIVSELRRESVRALIRQEIGFFERKQSESGTLTAEASRSPANVGHFIGIVLAQFISSLTNLLATLIMAFVLNWRLAVMVIPTLFATMVLGYINFKCQGRFEHSLTENINRQSAYINEAANSIILLSALSREAETVREFSQKYSLQSVGYSWLATTAVTMGGNQAMLFFFAGLFFYWGSRQVAAGTVARADVFSVMEAVVIAIHTSSEIWTYTGDLTRMTNALKTIQSWITRKPQIASCPVEKEKKFISTEIQGIEL